MKRAGIQAGENSATWQRSHNLVSGRRAKTLRAGIFSGLLIGTDALKFKLTITSCWLFSFMWGEDYHKRALENIAKKIVYVTYLTMPWSLVVC